MNRTLITAVALLFATVTFGHGRLSFLQCEHLENPIGVDSKAPRLSWRLPDGVTAQRQWEIIVGTDSSAVARGIGDMWSSGVVKSHKVIATYQGRALEPYTCYYWKVTAKTDNGIILKSPIAYFETGKMHPNNWDGWWIYDTKDLEIRPAGAFRKDFLTHGKIMSARAYIAAAGLFELYLNGFKVGNDRLEPAFTRFDRRTLYITRDVTDQIVDGKNTIGVLMGNGWYNHQPMAVWNFEVAPWRHRPSFCLDLRITYEDGSVQTIVSDKTWKTHFSEIIYNNIYVAEQVDNRLNLGKWATPDYNASSWSDVKLTSAPSENIVSQLMRPIRDVDTLKVISFKQLSDKNYIFDFGQNISGVTELTVKGESGTTFFLKHGELIRDGHVSTENIDYFYYPDSTRNELFATDIFILGGDKEETFRQKFGYKGFRYVEITTDRPVSLDAKNIVAFFVHSDIPQRGNIQSSNDIINWLWKSSCYSYLSNLVGYPTDCPQREKNGWTGDTNAAMDIGFYNFDPITVYEKWMNDHKDAQLPNGVYPNIIPSPGWGYDWGNGPDWTSTNILIPYKCWLFYGDDLLINTMYENNKSYIRYIEKNYPEGLTDWGLGDWLPVHETSTTELTSSIYYYVDVKILEKIATLIAHEADASHYSSLAEKIRTKINEKYLNKQTGIYANGTQTEMSMPLYWDVVPDEYRQKVADNLAIDIQNRGLDVGLLGSKAILGALSENGYLDIAYSLAVSTEFPSWGYWMKNGATTFYENWHIEQIRDLSLNHMMFGEINAWLYKALGGITPDEEKPGFAEFNVKPGFPKGLDQFEASFICPNGKICSGWLREGGIMRYYLTVPSNTIAHLSLPNLEKDLSCGTYSFIVKEE